MPSLLPYISPICLSLFLLLSLFFPLCSCGPGPYVDEWGNPQKIFLLASFNKISKVDGVEQLFTTDLYLSQYWVDRRLQPNITVDDEFDPETMFTPQIDFVNGNDVTQLVDAPYYFTSKPWWVTPELQAANNISDSDIWSVCDARYEGDFTVLLDFVEFPYDKQDAELRIESLYTASSLKLEFYLPPTAENLRGVLPKKFSVIGWDVQFVTIDSFDQFYTSYQDYYNRLVIKVHMSRQPDYYINKFVSGVILLVLLSIMLFVLAVNEADRMMGTLATFAGLITYLFVITQDSPRVPYSTRLDTFMSFSFYITSIMFFVHGFLYLFCQVDDKEETEQEKELEDGLLSFRGNTGFGDPAKNRKRIRAMVAQIHADKILSRQGTLNQIPTSDNESQQQIHDPNVPMQSDAQKPAAEHDPNDRSDRQELELSVRQRIAAAAVPVHPAPNENAYSAIAMPKPNPLLDGQLDSSRARTRQPKELKSGLFNHPRIQQSLAWLRSWAMTRQSDYFFVVVFSLVYLIGSAYIMKGPIVNKQSVTGE